MSPRGIVKAIGRGDRLAERPDLGSGARAERLAVVVAMTINIVAGLLGR
jgi:hypothetical protein